MKQKIITIYDLTSCKGCAKQIFSLFWSKDYAYLQQYYNIFTSLEYSPEDMPKKPDITFIAGTPMTRKDIILVKNLKKQSTVIIATGSCACASGNLGLVDKYNYNRLAYYVYGKKYENKTITTKSIDDIISVDYHLSGCPIDINQLKQLLADLAHDKITQEDTKTVCFSCKNKNNDCLLLKNKPCLGPITKDGCDARCPSYGQKCDGCFGLSSAANFQAMIIALKKQGKTKNEIKKILDLFFYQSKDYEKYLDKIAKIKINIKI